MSVLYILAASKWVAEHLADERGLQPIQWEYLHSTYQLRGERGGRYIRHSSYIERLGHHELELMLERREMIEVTNIPYGGFTDE